MSLRVLTAQQMRDADQKTIAAGTAPKKLMERAAAAVVQLIEREFKPLSQQRVVVVCGKGNNGADGLIIAEMLEDWVAALQVVRVTDPAVPLDLAATIVVDALLGTGFKGAVEGRHAELIFAMNVAFPLAKVVAVDIPSAMQVRADYTVTFGALKAEMLLSTNAAFAGQTVIADIGIPDSAMPKDLLLSEAGDFADLLQPRRVDSHKGTYGHVLVVGGAPGKTGAAEMAGLAALRAGAGLVTVACSNPSRLAPELMSQNLNDVVPDRATVLAIGPGLGYEPGLVWGLFEKAHGPVVIDADGLNSIAGTRFMGRGIETILTPHPGEMARLLGLAEGEKITNRVDTARAFAQARNLCLVLKGYRTLIAAPDGRVWINPTGSPALAKGGTGDILTGMIAGLIAQNCTNPITATRAAVWLHGRAAELGAAEWTEFSLLATDLLRYLPAAIRECAST